MELRSVLLFPGTYVLQGYYDSGSQVTLRHFGIQGSLTLSASAAQFLVDHSGGGISYNSTNHDPFDA